MAKRMSENNQAVIMKAFAKFASRMENEYGIKADFSNVKNDGQTLSFAAIVGFVANGELETNETKQAKAMMPTVGFKPEIVGKTFASLRGAITITAYKANASRNVLQITFNGKPGYSCSPQFISSVCVVDPKFAQYVIKDFDTSRLPQKRRRRSFANMF